MGAPSQNTRVLVFGLVLFAAAFASVPVPANDQLAGAACYLAHEKRVKEAMKLPPDQIEAAVRESARKLFACLKRAGLTK